ncbi:MAG TPA: 3-phosphoshikimate 1-carboxyvinyltransferase, partial [Pirellulales bacterium]
DSEDTRVMIESLRRLGFEVQADWASALVKIQGLGGIVPATTADLYIANSGTSVRFLTALAALGHGRFRLHGTPRMHQRPIQDLVDPLEQLGVRAECETASGCPPLIVEANGLPGGTAELRGNVSSQFLSGLLLVAPYAVQGVELTLVGTLVSQPYVEMTLAVMRAFGIDLAPTSLQHYAIAPAHYRPVAEYCIEPDASAASYFFAAAAISGGEVTVDGLSRGSLQGDIGFCDCLKQMGCEILYGQNSITAAGPRGAQKLRGIEVNMNAISDTVQTLATVAMFAEGPTIITGVAHIRFKETDRIGNLAIELRALGAIVDELPDGLRITPQNPHGARIATYDDHRMAMSLSLVGLRVPGVIIENPKCTEKTYPTFFDDLAKLSKI